MATARSKPPTPRRRNTAIPQFTLSPSEVVFAIFQQEAGKRLAQLNATEIELRFDDRQALDLRRALQALPKSASGYALTLTIAGKNEPVEVEQHLGGVFKVTRKKKGPDARRL